MDDRDLVPHRRQHWGVEPAPVTRDAPAPADAADDPWTGEEERAAARRILWRDSATILVGIIMVVLAVQLFSRGSGGLGSVSDGTALPSAQIRGPSAPAGSTEPGETPGQVLEPSFGLDLPPTGNPVRTQPPTGSQAPVNPPLVTPRPTRRPTSPPTTPPLTPAPTPEPTPEPTPPPTDTPPPTEPPTAEPTAAPIETPQTQAPDSPSPLP